MTATVGPDGLIVRGPIALPEWETRIHFEGYRRADTGLIPWSAKGRESMEQRIEWCGSSMSLEYLLSDEGLRQNFILKDRPGGTGDLLLGISVVTPLCMESEGTTGIIFRASDGLVKHAYRDLKVWDTSGRLLEASIAVDRSGQKIIIRVNDMDALYPITVDPVSTTADRTLVPTLGGNFGWSVAPAGDLNGDGYSDVAVGAYLASNGELNEGLVYVYYGSATGIPAAPSVILEADQPAANFGFAVDGAGDVNGDGFSDLIVGASTWESSAAEDKEGAAFIFHGSAAGISTTPAQILQPNGVNKYMGYIVAGLGDINGDGYSDVAAGGHLANYPSVSGNEGIAWIFLGSATGINPVFRHRLERDQAAAQFGGAISPAGDVNGDGFNDVIIGAHKFELNPGCPTATCDDGAIFIYHGSANALGVGANPAPALTFNTNGYSVRTGWAVSTAGDVNADGYSDIIIGDWRDSVGVAFNEGAALVYHGSPAGIVPVPVTILQTNQAFSYFGRSVSTAGDVNGDGYADVVVGAIQFANGQVLEGAMFLYLGSPAGISSSAFLRYESNIANAQLGESVTTAGDVNGDGYSDMIVGITNGTSAGSARIFHGGTYNVATLPSFSRPSGLPSARLGASTANAGDVNGDGYSDALFGAPEATNGQAGEGQVYLHYGGINGLTPGPALILEANVAGAGYGTGVASAGDVNGDGYADIVIGAPESGGTGRAYIHHGGPAGLGMAPALTLTGTAGSRFGAAVFKAGDVDSDGYSDVLIGAPGIETVYVHLGSPTGLDPVPHVLLTAPSPGSAFGSSVGTAGDVNGDGFSDIVVGAPDFTNIQALEGAAYVYLGDLFQVSNTPQVTVELNVAGRRIGTSVAGAGDMNGDGFSEIIVGAPFAATGELDEGIAYVFRGSPAGTSLVGFLNIQGNQIGANLGTSVAEAGDVNGDGYADVVIGAPNFTNGQANEGRVWVMLGAPAGLGTFATVEVDLAGALFGSAVAGGGDVDGDGYSDILAGAPSASPSFANEGIVHLFRGNSALSYNRLSRQYLTDLVSPLSTNSADFSDALFFGIGHRARSPIHRTTAKLRWEVVHEGQPFTGAPITNSVAFQANSAIWTDLGLSGTEIKELIAKAPGFYRHKWRVRVEYPMHKMIDGQRFSRWFYGYASAVGDIGILPIELVSFEGVPRSEGNLLYWSTATERGSSHFLVERSADGVQFMTIGSVSASGESERSIAYELLDTSAPNGLSYYRLQMVDRDGTMVPSPTIVVYRDGASLVIYPVPVNDVLNWSLPDVQVARTMVRDALGRLVLDGAPTTNGMSGIRVAELPTGTYTILLLDQEDVVVGRSRFLKR